MCVLTRENFDSVLFSLVNTFISLKHLPQLLVHHSRICLAFHGFHGLPHQCAESLFLTAVIILHSLWIVGSLTLN